jgi:hypothetical protein
MRQEVQMRRRELVVVVGLLLAGWVLVLFCIGILIERALLPGPTPAPAPTPRPMVTGRIA